MELVLNVEIANMLMNHKKSASSLHAVTNDLSGTEVVLIAKITSMHHPLAKNVFKTSVIAVNS